MQYSRNGMASRGSGPFVTRSAHAARAARAANLPATCLVAARDRDSRDGQARAPDRARATVGLARGQGSRDSRDSHNEHRRAPDCPRRITLIALSEVARASFDPFRDARAGPPGTGSTFAQSIAITDRSHGVALRLAARGKTQVTASENHTARRAPRCALRWRARLATKASIGIGRGLRSPRCAPTGTGESHSKTCGLIGFRRGYGRWIAQVRPPSATRVRPQVRPKSAEVRPLRTRVAACTGSQRAARRPHLQTDWSFPFWDRVPLYWPRRVCKRETRAKREPE